MVATDTLSARTDSKNIWLERIFVAAVCLLAGWAYFSFFVNKAYVEVELHVDRKSDFKIYWQTPDHNYAEQYAAVIHASPEKTSYSVWLTNIKDVTKLRIDPHTYAGEARIGRLSIVQEGVEPINFDAPEKFAALTVVGQITDYSADDSGLLVHSSGNDPNFEYVPVVMIQHLWTPWLLARLLFVVFIAFLIIVCTRKWVNKLRIVPVLLFGVWGLLIVMAGITKYNVHPDEYVHIAAARYYENHWLPPVIEDPAIRDSYSTYGISRLNNGEIYYLLAGKFYKFMLSFKVPQDFAMRGFNLFLFGLIFLYAMRSRVARMVAVPFLISAQLWYVFSYCNSDALALAVSFLAVCQVLDPESVFNRYLKGEGRVPAVFSFIGLGLLFGCLLLLKKNYYPLIALLSVTLVVKLFFWPEFYWERRTAILRLVAVCLLGITCAGLRIGADYMVNGPDRVEKITKLQEETAHYWYKPSTPLEKKHMFLYRKARGTTLEHIIKVDQWFEHSFQSAFGTFGYFTISASDGFYDLVRWSGLLLLCYFLATIYWRGGLDGAFMATTTVCLALALVGASLYHSWTNDYQVQGRYLFPIVPMLGLLYGWAGKAVNVRVLMLGVMPMFFLAVYIFIFQAIQCLPKI